MASGNVHKLVTLSKHSKEKQVKDSRNVLQTMNCVMEDKSMLQ